MKHKHNVGFTIVELLIVIVVIAILAAITLVAFNGMQRRAATSALHSDMRGAATQLGSINALNGSYPTNVEVSGTELLKKSDKTTFQYSLLANNSYCLTASSERLGSDSYYISSSNTKPQEGTCAGHAIAGPITDGVFMQAVTSASCKAERTMAVDARDNRTYWVKKIADGKCWMLTNMAYAGGGSNTYNDVKTIINSTNNSQTAAHYYITPGANPTTNPTQPSASANGLGQYGYLYNWCGAMAGETGGDCTVGSNPTSSVGSSICPAGWRMPTISDYTALNAAVNGGSSSTNAGLLSAWLGSKGGHWNSGDFKDQTNVGAYWSSTQSVGSEAYRLDHLGSYTGTSSLSKHYGLAVRCVAL